jgi:hypothetical protein
MHTHIYTSVIYYSKLLLSSMKIGLLASPVVDILQVEVAVQL